MYIFAIILFLLTFVEIMDLGIIRDYSDRGWDLHLKGYVLEENSIFYKVCTKQGGIFMPDEYNDGYYKCEIPFSDSGKACTDKSQCKGTCTIDYIPNDCELDQSGLGNFHPNPEVYSLWRCTESPEGRCTSGMESSCVGCYYILIGDKQIEKSRLIGD